MKPQNNSYKRGILAKPKHEPDTTKFKLIVWYAEKPNGEFYSEVEKLQNKNRKYHDSIDFILTPGGYVTRHDEALNKLLHHLEKYKSKIINAWLLMNDFANSKQYLIGQFFKDENKNKFIQPTFTKYEKIQYNEKIIFDKWNKEQFEIKQRELIANQVFCTGLLAPPIREFTLKHFETL